MDIFKDQIFALLGHNGAGKTTTISMMNGLIEKTSGNLSILGYDYKNNSNQIKKILGICTQYNIIFDYLTVKEHLQMYATIKGVKKNIDQEIDEVLQDIDLYHKRKALASSLSGG